MSLKVNDIIEFEVKINILIPEDMKNQEGLVVQDFKREYSVSWLLNDAQEIGNYTLDVEEGMSSVEDDIECLIKEEMKEKYSEVIDYEIFDMNKAEYEYQCAKVKIKALKA